MNRLTTIDLNKLTPHSVGLDRMFNDMFRYVEHPQNAGYPPYNIVQEDEHFLIEMALAGVRMEEVDIEVADGVLTITKILYKRRVSLASIDNSLYTILYRTD